MTRKHGKHEHHSEHEPHEQPAEAAQEKQPCEAAQAETAQEKQPCQAAQAEDNLLERLQRVSADYLNYQKRAQRDIEQARIFANEQLIKELLPVLDDMERALIVARENHGEDNPLYTGMQMVHDKAMETLGRYGLAVIKAEGAAFDPEVHSAMMQQESAEVPPNTVLKEVLRGYTLKGRTIRPCGVIVSKAPEGPGGQQENKEQR